MPSSRTSGGTQGLMEHCQQERLELPHSQRSLLSLSSHSQRRSQRQQLQLWLCIMQDRFPGTLPTPMPKNPRLQPKLQSIVWPPVIEYSGESSPRNILCRGFHEGALHRQILLLCRICQIPGQRSAHAAVLHAVAGCACIDLRQLGITNFPCFFVFHAITPGLVFRRGKESCNRDC